MPPLEKGQRPVVPLETMKALVTDAFTGATERHIEVGDGLSFFLIQKGKGITKTMMREWMLPNGLASRDLEAES